MHTYRDIMIDLFVSSGGLIIGDLLHMSCDIKDANIY